MKKQKIAIIGAGPAGLTAAYLLSKAGQEVHIFEADRNTWVGYPAQKPIRAIISILADTGFSANPRKWKISGQKFWVMKCCKDPGVPGSIIRKNISVIRWWPWML